MTRRALAALTGLALLGAAVSLYQAWLVNLPPPEAVAKTEWCRFTRQVDCFESLARYGKTIGIGPLPVFATLLALYFWMTALAVSAWLATPARAEGLVGLAGLAAFPATGLALYVLLHDYRVAGVTSASAIASAGLGLTLSAQAVLRGFPAAGLRAAAAPGAALLAAAALFAFLVHDAGETRHDAYRVTVQRESAQAPPNVLYSAPPRNLPRTGAARLGGRAAPNQALVFLADDDASRALARELAARETEFADDFLVHLYAPGRLGRALIGAQHAGRLRAFLSVAENAATEAGDGDASGFDVDALLAWQQENVPTDLPPRPCTMIRGRPVPTPTADAVLNALDN